MQVLALEASTDACSVALLAAGEIVLEHVVEPRAHTRLLLPQVAGLLRAAQLTAADLDALAFGCGPGSFTGLRLAAAVAQGLAWAHELPVLCVSSLAALAETAVARADLQGPTTVVTLVDARMDEVYFNAFEVLPAGAQLTPRVRALGADRILSPQAAAQAIAALERPGGAAWVLGSGLRYPDFAELAGGVMTMDAAALPDAAAVLRLALPRLAAGERPPARDAVPVYLRDASRWQRTAGAD